MTPDQPWPHPRLIAHRGGAHCAPENTLPAFAEAARRGYHAIECDVQLTADGVPVVIHDGTLERTTNGFGRIADRSSANIAGLDAGAWFDPRFAGTRVPTLAAAGACWQSHGLLPVIELKTGEGQDPQRLAVTVATWVADAWRGPMPLIISFSDEALIAAFRTAPQVPRGLLRERTELHGWQAAMQSTRSSFLDLDARSITPALVAEAHAASWGLVAWTVNDPARCAALLAMGVDAVTTDAIDRIAP